MTDALNEGSFEPELERMISIIQAGDRASYVALIRKVPYEQRDQLLWPAMGAQHSATINLVDELVSWPNDRASEAMNYLVPAIGHAPTLSPVDARKLLHFAPSVGLSFLHRLAESLSPHFAREFELGALLGSELQVDAHSEAEYRVWAQALCSASPLRALSLARSMTTSDPGQARVFSAILQYLPVRLEEVVAEIATRPEALIEQAVTAAAVIGEFGWFGMSSLARVLPGAAVRLTLGASAGERGAVLAGCSVLQLRWEGGPRQDLVELAEVVAQATLAHASYCAPVGRALSSMLHNDQTRPVGERCLERMGTCQTLNPVESMEEAFDALCEFPESFGNVLTAWLLTPGISFNALRSLLSKCGSGRAPVVLQIAMFGAAPAPRKLAAGRRLLSLCINGEVLCLFIGLLAETTSLQPHGLQLAEGLLNQAFIEYPNATVEFLKANTRPDAKTKPHASLYRGVLANALRWQRVLGRLPPLKELRPDDQRKRALQSMHWRRNEEIVRIARERSVFASLATQVNVAQGRKFATHHGRGAPQVTEMVQTRHSMELPSSELADPTGGALTRLATLSAAQ